MTDETPKSDVVPDAVPDVTPDKVVDDAPVPTPDPPSDGGGDRIKSLEDLVSNLQEAVTDLSNKVSGLAPVPVVDPEPEELDESPKSVPWLHRGFSGKD